MEHHVVRNNYRNGLKPKLISHSEIRVIAVVFYDNICFPSFVHAKMVASYSTDKV